MTNGRSDRGGSHRDGKRDPGRLGTSPALMSTSRTLISTLQKLWKPPAVQRDERDGSTPVRSREPGGETDGDQAHFGGWHYKTPFPDCTQCSRIKYVYVPQAQAPWETLLCILTHETGRFQCGARRAQASCPAPPQTSCVTKGAAPPSSESSYPRL